MFTALIAKAKEAYTTFGFIPYVIGKQLESFGVNVVTLEKNLALGRV